MKPARPSPALVIALVALFSSLGGVSYGVATGFIDSREIKDNEIRTRDLRNNDVRTRDLRNNDVRTRDLRNNDVRGRDIRNSTIQGRDVALSTITGADVDESNLDQVPSAVNADSLGGKAADQYLDRSAFIPFSARLSAGQTLELARHGSVSVQARCETTGGMDRVTLLAATTVNGAVSAGADDNDGAAGGTLNPDTPADARQLTLLQAPSGNRLVASDDPAAPVSGAFVLGPDGKGIHLVASDSTALGLNFPVGVKCLAAGLLVPTG